MNDRCVMFGWVDFSDEERRRSAEVMNLVRYPTAIDELGFGVLRDAFANMFFPATSTLHTHAHYYYLVAYLMKDIERNGTGKSLEELQQMLRDGEIATARRLVAWSRQNAPGVSGITGSTRIDSGWVKMTPASMDWAAIQRLGIFKKPDMKMQAFLRSVAASSEPPSAMRDETSLESLVDSARKSFWDVPLEIYRSWSEGDELSLWLDPIEARDLKKRIKRLFPQSLYASIVDYKSVDALKPAIVDPIFNSTSFISLVESGELAHLNCTPELRALCEIAANLSSFVSLLHIRFNYILRKKAEIPEFESDFASQLWHQYAYDSSSVYHRRTVLFNVNETFRACGVSASSAREIETHRFLRAALSAYLAHDLETLDVLIERREKHLKGAPRSKIANAKAHAQEWLGGIELSYRLGVALMVASEIDMALEVDDAEPR